MILASQNATEILPRLWLGNMEASQDQAFLRKNQITVIINCTKDLPFLPLSGIYKYRVPVNDDLQKTEINAMVGWLDKILPIIHHHYQQGRAILIHCFAGMQRSAIVTYSFLYAYYLRDPKATYNFIRSKRPIVFRPFINFKSSFCQKFKVPPSKLPFN